MKKDVNVSLVQGGKLTKGGWLSIVSFLLVAVIALSVALGLVVKSHKEEKPAEEVYAGGGMVLPEEAEENGISLVSMEIPKEKYEDYGIMPIAETSYSVTATAKAAGEVELYEVQQKFNWSLAWASSNAADVNTYVGLSASEGARTATVSLLKPFSTKILLKCTWAYNDTQSGSVTLDYAKRFKGFNIQYASSVAKSASDESHLTTVLVEPGEESRFDVVEVQMHFANPFAGGSWQDGPSNAVVFRVVEPVFDSVGTLDNSVVSVRNSVSGKKDGYPVESSPLNEISNQMFVWPTDSPWVERLNSFYVSGGSAARASNQCIPSDTNSFTQIEFFKSMCVSNAYLSEAFGDFDKEPTDWQALEPFIEQLGDALTFSVYFPAYVVLQYGEMVSFHSSVDCITHVDYLTASSIDFTKSNFVF